MSEKYYLIAGTSAAEVERKTGLHGHDTPLGTLVEAPTPFDLFREIERFKRAVEPSPRCTCGAWAIVHRPDCPAGGAVT